MASLSDSELAEMTQDDRAKALGMITEQLTGRSLFIEFNPDEEERYTYPWAPDVDYNKRTEVDTDDLDTIEVNRMLQEAMAEGYGTIVVKNPRGK
ncbi:MAG: GXGXG motif-containing protein, partial [SAR202 cluster bacterium]|nr:GXGXG motif-containing protein [SAR202 cluster bacterium]